MKRKVFMLLYDIDVNKGGITRVMLNRSKLFNDRGWDVDLVTLDYKTNYDEISANLRNVGRLAEEVNILNVYDYYRDKNTVTGLKDEAIEYYNELSQINEEGYQVQDDYEEKRNARYFVDGVYCKYKKWTKNGLLKHVDYFNENRSRTLREEFAEDGHVCKKTFFDLHTNKVRQELFFTVDGFCFLNRWFNDKEKISNIFLFDKYSNKVERFKNNQQFHTYWLNELCRSYEEKPFMICDGVGSSTKVMEMDDKLVNRIYAIHTNHFAAPHEYGSYIKDNHEPLLENLSNVEAVVVLTDKQKNDIIRQFGDYDNLFVIPHFVSKSDRQAYKQKNLVTAVSRYHKEKGLDELIKAFELVKEKIPEARLEIHGDGPDRDRLEGLIEELNLKDSVFLMGYSNSIDEVLGRSTVSALTSKFEGFSMVIIESLMNKTPVVSYDVSYGPSDIIESGKTGYVVPNKDKEELAKKIIKLLKAPIKANVMGERGHSYVINKYNEDNHFKYWLNLFNHLVQKETQPVESNGIK
ncbi:glycosyltransferase [Virgibacillus senegalensis]|uniref:glycosyltransferase n=1 Tax=Virgibacillus senegalensis TaxID=1499679 RepID=UPI00069F9BCE|nr:glycosyltransferase [Virgibacillus senegalensis]